MSLGAAVGETDGRRVGDAVGVAVVGNDVGATGDNVIPWLGCPVGARVHAEQVPGHA